VDLETETCKAYMSPKIKWKLGNCPLATNIRKKITQEKERKGQQKQKKKK
jgi:hypothetical protein